MVNAHITCYLRDQNDNWFLYDGIVEDRIRRLNYKQLKYCDADNMILVKV